MSKIETNTIDTVSGTTNLTIGSTNSSTVTFENGSCTGHMYPAFLATRTTTQSIPNNAYTKVQFDTEVFDTDSCYDNSTNYRFTPTVAGKYFVTAQAGFENFNNTNHRVIWNIYKNGSPYSLVGDMALSTDAGADPTLIVSTIVEMNGSSDYIELFAYQNSGGSVNIKGVDTQVKFHAFRIGS